MAEYVNQTLEEMIPELEEMNRLGLFTIKETRSILRHRQNYEYRLRQLTKTKPSFITYIEYEKKLLELLKIRRKKIASDSNKRDIEKSIADRIHQLYRLVTVRFKEDVFLWIQHIEFTKALREKAYVTRLYEKALKIHTHNEDLWVAAAQWESSQDGNNNQELAREILLKAQRVNPESELIVLEIFRMELEVAKKLLKRKAVLGITDTEATKDSNGAEEDKIAELKLAEIIYTKGIELMPGNAEFHLKMLNVCSNFKDARQLQKVIISDLRRLYPHVPAVWNGLAWIHLSSFKNMSPEQKSVGVQRCLEVYGEAVQQIPTETMWSYCLRAHLSILDMKGIRSELKESLLHFTLSRFQTALTTDCLSEELYVRLISLLNELSFYDDLVFVCEKGSDKYPSSASIWLARLQAMAQKEEDDEVVSRTLRSALTHVQGKDCWNLWQFVLTLFASRKSSLLEELMERACRCSNPDVCKPAKEWGLSWTFRQAGIKSLRAVYSRLKTMRPISLQFYRIYIQAETAQPEPSLELIRNAFEEALLEFGLNEPDVWLNYMEMEKTVAKDAGRSGLLQQRALSSLDSHLKESFVRKQIMIGLAG